MTAQSRGQGKIKILVVITALLTLLASCGKKNVVNSSNNTGNNGGFTGYDPNINPPITGGGGGQAGSDIASIINSIQCRQGQRLNGVYVYNIGASGTHTTLYGNFQQGQASGTSAKLYVGVSYFNDVMIVQKLTNGSQVMGYNVFLSYCSQSSNTGTPLISDQRPMSGFRADYGIVLDEDNNCGYGSVDAAKNTLITAQAMQVNYNGYPVNLQAFPVWTTFYKPYCNGQF